jgi:hypothetical protein
VHLDARAGDGVAWIPDLTLDDGRIEVDLRGRNQPGQSFVGIAFHGADEQTYEGVYVRPFNFQSDDPERRAHSVQYISMPAYTWDRLREEDPGRYEAALDPAPDPEAWVHLSVEVTGSSVRVYVNDAAEPALVVERLGDLGRGNVGLWVGHNAEGDFSNLRITNARRSSVGGDSDSRGARGARRSNGDAQGGVTISGDRGIGESGNRGTGEPGNVAFVETVWSAAGRLCRSGAP